MKKLFVVAALTLLAASANASGCRITSNMDVSLGQKFDQYGGWRFDNFQEVCQKLKRARARVQVLGMPAVLSNRSIGYGHVFVLDADTNVGTTDYSRKNIQVNNDASQDVADRIMVEAINEAMNNWEGLDKALAALEKSRREAKAAYKK